jgi:hypothetical protein
VGFGVAPCIRREFVRSGGSVNVRMFVTGVRVMRCAVRGVPHLQGVALRTRRRPRARADREQPQRNPTLRARSMACPRAELHHPHRIEVVIKKA